MHSSSDTPAVGIPYGLINSRWERDFEVFFRQRNIAARWGDPGSYRTFLKGKKRILDEFCLPLKLFAGQVLEIAEETDLDVFIPMVLGNREKNCFLCPLQFRLGDIMVNSGILPRERLFSPCFEFDDNLLLLHAGTEPAAAESAGTKGAAIEAPEAFPEESNSGGKPVIAIVGRSYVLENPFLNQGIPGLLEKIGFETVLCSGKSGSGGGRIEAGGGGGGGEGGDGGSRGEAGGEGESGNRIQTSRVRSRRSAGAGRIQDDCIRIGCPVRSRGEVRPLPEYAHFALTAGLLREAEELFLRKPPAGVVILKPFLCGPDCDIEENLGEVMPADRNIPFLVHVVDENCSEEGLRTRLEAFGDLITRRQRIA